MNVVNDSRYEHRGELNDMAVAVAHLDVLTSNLTSKNSELVSEANQLIYSDKRLSADVKYLCLSSLTTARKLLYIWNEFSEDNLRFQLIVSNQNVSDSYRKAVVKALQYKINILCGQWQKINDDNVVIAAIQMQKLFGNFSSLINGLNAKLESELKRLPSSICKRLSV